MDVLSDKKVSRLVATHGMTRVYEMEDNTWITARDGTVAWRNNNPGNLKFEFSGSADTTVHNPRTKDVALRNAQRAYDGIVDLDQWGNAVFESYEAGRTAQEQLVLRQHGSRTVDEMVMRYSTADYSGATHHDSQLRTIYATAASEGFDLHGKTIDGMTNDERNALLDGIARAESWRPGTTSQSPPLTDDQLAAALHAHPQHGAASPHGSPNIHRQGDRGEAVGTLQADLAALGFTGRDGSPIHADSASGRTRGRH